MIIYEINKYKSPVAPPLLPASASKSYSCSIINPLGIFTETLSLLCICHYHYIATRIVYSLTISITFRTSSEQKSLPDLTFPSATEPILASILVQNSSSASRTFFVSSVVYFLFKPDMLPLNP